MNDDMKKAIREAVGEGIDDTLTKYGIDTSDPTAMQADMVYLRKSRTGSDELIKWTKRTAIATALSGAAVALWQGIKAIIYSGG